jgi:non-specific serine/threonine protein kinase
LQFLDRRGLTQLALRLCNVLAELWQYRGYLSEGWVWMARVLERPGGELKTRGRALGWAGNFAWFQGDPLAARALHEQNLVIDQEIGDVMHVACVLSALGRDALSLGDYREAERLSEDALQRFVALAEGSLQPIAEEIWVLYTLGIAAHEQMDWSRAEAIHTRCLERADQYGNVPISCLPRYGLGRVAHAQGDLARARRWLEQALAGQRAADDPSLVSLTLVALGQVLLDAGDLGGARAAFAESLVLFERLGDQVGLSQGLDACAGLMVAEHQLERALQIVGAAERLRAAGQTPRSPADRATLERWLEPAYRLIDEASVATLMDRGRTLSTVEAIALAAGAPRPVGVKRGLSALTPREVEVAALIAERLSNRQIGERLLITRRTAAAHVEHILGKLAFTSRIQVGIWASEHELVN